MDERESTMTVKVREARGLLSKEASSSLNPFCIIGFYSKELGWLGKEQGVSEHRISSVLKKTDSPFWNFEQKFKIKGECSAEFRIEIRSKSKMSFGGDLVAFASLPREKFQHSLTFDDWIPLNQPESPSSPDQKLPPAGELFLTIAFRSGNDIAADKAEKNSLKEQQMLERSKKRNTILARGKFSKWISKIEDEKMPLSDRLDSLVQLYNFSADLQNFQVIQSLVPTTELINTIVNRSRSLQDRLFCALTCGLIGNLAQNTTFHQELLDVGSGDFALESLKHFTIQNYVEESSVVILILKPFAFLTRDGTTALASKKKLTMNIIPPILELINTFNTFDKSGLSVILLLLTTLGNIAENIFVDAFPYETMDILASCIRRWSGSIEIANLVGKILYFFNHSPRSEELLRHNSEKMLESLMETFFSRYVVDVQHTNRLPFYKDTDLLNVVLPMISLHCLLAPLDNLGSYISPQTFCVLGDILHENPWHECIAHNVLNILYAFFTRLGRDQVLREIAPVHKKLMPSFLVVMRNFKRKSRSIADLGQSLVPFLTHNIAIASEIAKADCADGPL